MRSPLTRYVLILTVLLSLLLMVQASQASLVSHWPLENVTDIVGGYDLVNVSMVGTDGVNNEGFLATARTNRLYSGGLLDAISSKWTSLTLSIWINISNCSTDDTFWRKSNVAGEDRLRVQMNASCHIVFVTEENNNALDLLYMHGPVTENVWHHVVIQWSETEGKQIYFDGALNVSNPAETTLMRNGSNGDFFLNNIEGGAPTTGINGSIDEAKFFNETLNSSEVLALYQEFSAGVIDVTLVSPSAFYHTNNATINFTFDVQSTVAPSDCTLLINDSTNETRTGLGNGTQGITTPIGEGTWTWTVNCSNGTVSYQPGARSIIVDRTSPVWTFLPGNFFASDNSSNLRTWNGLKPFNLKLSDQYIYAWNITIENSSGARYYDNLTTGSTASEVIFNNSLNMSNWTSGKYFVTLQAEDDHTAHTIPPYQHGPIASGYEWVTDTGVTIRVTAPGATLSTQKLSDRYTFTASFPGEREAVIFLLKSSEPLHYRGSLYPFPSFVTGKPFRGHWIDFNTDGLNNFFVEEQDYSQGFYRYQVHLNRTPSAEWDFESLGGLNLAYESYSFLLNTTPRQVENISMTTRNETSITISWDVWSETNFTEIVRNGTSILNTTNTTYKDSGLNTGSYYNYILYAYGVGNVSNVSVSSENNITVRTQYNTRLNISIYDEQTNTLINDTNFTFEIIATNTLYAYNYSTTNGTLNVQFLEPDDYEIRYFGTENDSAYSTPRKYFVTLAEGSNENIRFYHIKDSESTFFIPTVRDEIGDTVPGATVYLIRGYVESGAFVSRTVEMAKTDPNGQAVLRIEPNDAFYKFFVFSEAGNLTTSEFFQITTQSLTLIVKEEDRFFISLPDLNDAVLVLEYLNDTDTFRLDWVDGTNTIVRGCLKVKQIKEGQESTVYDSCSQTSTGSLIYTVADSSGSYIASAEVCGTGANCFVSSESQDFDQFFLNWGLLGVFTTILVVLLFMMASGSAQGVLVSGGLGLVFMGLIGVMAQTWTAIVGILIVIMVGVYMMRT